MATDKQMIQNALKIHPTEVFNREHGLQLFAHSRIVVLDGHRLRTILETRQERALSWEEWLDVRSAWVKFHAAVLLEMTEGDTHAQLQRALYRPPVGTLYVLTEEI